MRADNYVYHVGPAAFVKVAALYMPLSNIILPNPLSLVSIREEEIKTMRSRLVRYESRLAVHVLRDGQYQAVAGRCRDDLMRLNQIQFDVENGLVTSPDVRCMVLAPQPRAVLEACMSVTLIISCS